MAKLYNLARMTTATTGTGTITLGSAVSGYLTFALAGVVDADIVYYAIKDGANSEIGIGTYTASGTALSRDTILNSTNTGSKISLSGAAEVFITPPASAWREKLSDNRTYYVRPDGSDSNTGLANTSGGAFLTIQRAIDIVAALDLATFNVTIQVADGTYTGATVVSGAWIGRGTVTIVGNTTTPANVIISTTSASCFTVSIGAKVVLSGMELRTTTTGNCVFVGGGGSLAQVGVGGVGVRFGTCAEVHMRADATGKIAIGANYSIVGSAGQHVLVVNGGLFEAAGQTITITGTPAFGVFCYAQSLGLVSLYSITWSGSATGQRYNVSGNSVLNTFGQSTTYLPGNSVGGTGSGGQYL